MKKLFFLVFFIANIVNANDLKEAAIKADFSCEGENCFVCLGEKSFDSCTNTDNKGFIKIPQSGLPTAYGRGGFQSDGCELLAKSYFDDQTVSELEKLALEGMSTEKDIKVTVFTNDQYILTVFNYAEIENPKDSRNRRLMDVMQCKLNQTN